MNHKLWWPRFDLIWPSLDPQKGIQKRKLNSIACYQKRIGMMWIVMEQFSNSIQRFATLFLSACITSFAKYWKGPRWVNSLPVDFRSTSSQLPVHLRITSGPFPLTALLWDPWKFAFYCMLFLLQIFLWVRNATKCLYEFELIQYMPIESNASFGRTKEWFLSLIMVIFTDWVSRDGMLNKNSH